jgi:hypothetical protein
MKLIFLTVLILCAFSNVALAGEVVEGNGIMAAESKSLACDRAMAMAKKEAIEFLGIKIKTEVNILQSDLNGISTQSFDLKVKQQTNAVIKILEKSVNIQFDATTGLITCDIKSKFDVTLNNVPNKDSESNNQVSKMAQNRIRKILENANQLNKTGEFNSALFQYKTILDLSTDPEMRRMALDGIVNASLSLRSASQIQPAVEPPSISAAKIPVELSSPVVAKVSTINGSDISGIYSADIVYEPFGNKVFGRRPNITVTLTQNGKKISGTYRSSSKGGIIWGEIEEDNLKFGFQTSDGYSGRGQWTVNPASKEMIGKWSQPGTTAGSGNFNLTYIKKRSASPSQPLDESSAISAAKIPVGLSSPVVAKVSTINGSDISGIYSADIVYDPFGNRVFGRRPNITVTLTQNGKKISGTYRSGSKGGVIWGEIEEDNLKFGFQTSDGYSGRGQWTVNPASKEMIGKWSGYGPGGSGTAGSGNWNLTYIKKR